MWDLPDPRRANPGGGEAFLRAWGGPSRPGASAMSPEAEAPNLVLNAITEENPKPYRRRAQATFVASVLELPRFPEEPIKELYPYLVRALSNVLLAYVPGEGVAFLTLELGHYREKEGEGFYERVAEPPACPSPAAAWSLTNIFVPRPGAGALGRGRANRKHVPGGQEAQGVGPSARALPH
jgi:hypothetical protein